MPTRTTATVLAAVMAAALFGAGACVGPAPESPTGRVQQRLDVCAVSLDGALCDDGKPCTTLDICKGGICVGTMSADGTPCTTGDVCVIRNSQVCMAGKCMGTPAPDGYPCLDDDACTDPDTCHAGKCVPGPSKVCDDSNVCTNDSCVAATGCVFMPIPECVPDAGTDVSDVRDAADVADTADAITDVIMPMDMMPVDVPPMDTPPMDMLPLDRPSSDLPVDIVLPDAVADLPLDRLGDAPSDPIGEGGGDSPLIDKPPPLDGPREAPDAGPLDTSGDQGEVGPDLRARGGACICSAGDGAGGPGSLAFGLLLAIAAVRRRRP